MKKLLAILLTLAVLCSVSVSAFAADTDVTTFTFAEVAEDLAEIDADGLIHQVGGYVLWLPSFFEEQELSDERIEQGYIANIMAADESAAVIAFTDTNEEGADLETLAKAYTGAGLEAEVVEVNGVPGMLYVDETSDTLNLLFLEGEDKKGETVISFYPLSDEGFSSLASMVLRTVQPGILWSSVEEIAATVDENAEFRSVGDYGVAMWVPSVFEGIELTDEDIENGYIAGLKTADDSAEVWIYTWDNEDNDTLESLKEYYLEKGCEDADIGMINGIRVITHSDTEDDTMNAAVLLDNNQFLQFCFWPASDEDFATIVKLMVSSLQVIG